MDPGNLLVAAGILFCGFTFTTIYNLTKFLNLVMFSESTFYRLQKEYLFPVISDAKQKHLGCKKVQGQSEATLQTGRRDQKV